MFQNVNFASISFTEERTQSDQPERCAPSDHNTCVTETRWQRCSFARKIAPRSGLPWHVDVLRFYGTRSAK